MILSVFDSMDVGVATGVIDVFACRCAPVSAKVVLCCRAWRGLVTLGLFFLARNPATCAI